MAEHKSYYAIIPANVRYDNELVASAKLLYGEITALCNERGYCWASNNYFADLYGVSKSTISRWISQLTDKGYIASRLTYKEGTKEVEARLITLATPPIKNEYTYTQKCDDPIRKNEYTPIRKNEKDNNTLFNITSNNTDDDDKDPILFWQNNINFNVNPIETELIQDWEKDFPNELIIEAIKRTGLANARSARYTDKILKSWRKDQITTLAQLEAKEAQGNATTQRSNASHTPKNQAESEILQRAASYTGDYAKYKNL